MADEKYLERMEKMLQDLIGIVDKTNSMLVETNELLVHFEQKIDTRLERIEAKCIDYVLLCRSKNPVTPIRF